MTGSINKNTEVEIFFGVYSDGKEGGSDGKKGSKDGGECHFKCVSSAEKYYIFE